MSDVVVIGGGIVGLASAYELTRAGASVTLLEYGKTGMQATNAAAGMLAPLGESGSRGHPLREIGIRALSQYPALVQKLEAGLGFGLEYQQNGILRVAFDSAGLDELRQSCISGGDMAAVQPLDASTCRELEPRISERVAGGVVSASEGCISSQLLTLALERAAIVSGATIRNDTPVDGFDVRSGQVVAVRSRGLGFSCDFVVLAAGARSGQIAGRLGVSLPLRPVRGQMIALGGMRPPIRHIVWGPEGYLVPRVNGLIFAGATVEDVGFRRRTTVAGVRRLRSMACRLLPQLAAATVHFAWAGLRPGTADDLPIIGPLKAYANVIAATGHYRNGILLGPLTGELVARGICWGDWSGVPADFRPDRFEDPTGGAGRSSARSGRRA